MNQNMALELRLQRDDGKSLRKINNIAETRRGRLKSDTLIERTLYLIVEFKIIL